MNKKKSVSSSKQKNQPTLIAKVEKQTLAQFSGPLPAPEDFKKYEQILPGAADRILKMAENEQSFRHTLQSKVVKNETTHIRLGIFSGFLIAITAIIGGIILTAMNNSVYGISTIIAALASLIAVFFIGKTKQG